GRLIDCRNKRRCATAHAMVAAPVTGNRCRRWQATLLALLALLGAGTAAARGRRPLCPGGHFLLDEGTSLVVGTTQTPATEAVVIADDHTVTISIGCAPAPVKLRRAAHGTVVQAPRRAGGRGPRPPGPPGGALAPT